MISRICFTLFCISEKFPDRKFAICNSCLWQRSHTIILVCKRGVLPDNILNTLPHKIAYHAVRHPFRDISRFAIRKSHTHSIDPPRRDCIRSSSRPSTDTIPAIFIICDLSCKAIIRGRITLPVIPNPLS